LTGLLANTGNLLDGAQHASTGAFVEEILDENVSGGKDKYVYSYLFIASHRSEASVCNCVTRYGGEEERYAQPSGVAVIDNPAGRVYKGSQDA
jgi:hypothetical protein